MQHVRESVWGTHARAGAGWRATTILLLAIAICASALAVTRSERIERVPEVVRWIPQRQVALTSSAATHEAGPYASPIKAPEVGRPADRIAGVTYPIPPAERIRDRRSANRIRVGSVRERAPRSRRRTRRP
jgi:hypothetical protein